MSKEYPIKLFYESASGYIGLKMVRETKCFYIDQYGNKINKNTMTLGKGWNSTTYFEWSPDVDKRLKLQKLDFDYRTKLKELIDNSQKTTSAFKKYLLDAVKKFDATEGTK